MSSQRDWRDNAPYDLAETLPSPGIAWEFLRRDGDYQQAYLAAIKQSPQEADRTAGRWGLRFRGRSPPGRHRS